MQADTLYCRTSDVLIRFMDVLLFAYALILRDLSPFLHEECHLALPLPYDLSSSYYRTDNTTRTKKIFPWLGVCCNHIVGVSDLLIVVMLVIVWIFLQELQLFWKSTGMFKFRMPVLHLNILREGFTFNRSVFYYSNNTLLDMNREQVFHLKWCCSSWSHPCNREYML